MDNNKKTAKPRPEEIGSFEYNTQLKRMVLPEYGRNVQSMVDHALTIADRDERTRCANTIINIMGNLFPHLRDTEDFKHKLWDHLAIMSDFKLDIDYPYEVIQKEELHTKPDAVSYGSNRRLRSRLYGKYIDEMLEKACELEPGPEQDALIKMVAVQMKRSCMSMTRDGEVEDERVFSDIYDMTQGRIDIDPSLLKLVIPKEQSPKQAQPTGKAKKVQRKAVR